MVVFALLGCGPLPKGDESRPDIILVSIDSLRADHLSSYGYKRNTTPGIDELAAEGLKFTRARSASPWTLPSHLTMLTGLWPLEHQVIEDDLALRPDVPMVQEALQAAGWSTAGFVSTVYVSGGYGFSRGFDTFSDYAISEKDNLFHSVRVDKLVDDAIAWMKEQKGKPSFIFLHIYDVHYPYAPPEPWNEKFDGAGSLDELKYKHYKYYLRHPISARRMKHQVAQYDESLAWVDHELTRLRAAWSDSSRPATWIITSDHGEEFGERGSWGHAHTLHPEALRIPLIVAGPGLSPAVRAETVGTIDLAPTIAAIAGAPWRRGDGVDLRGTVSERTFYAETSRFDSAKISILRDKKRLDLDLSSSRRRLYDLSADPAERHPLVDTAEEPTTEADAFAPALSALEDALWDTMGTPWTADEGIVSTTGWLIQRGATQQTLNAPANFLLYPPDSSIYLQGQAAFHGLVDAPVAGPLRYEGPRRADPITLSDQTKKQLEALGYIQGPEE